MNYHNEPSDIPKGQHYAVLLFDTITIPGDERSRTNPGHGYGESTETIVKYITFVSQDEMEGWIAKQNQYVRFAPILSQPLTIERTVKVKVQ